MTAPAMHTRTVQIATYVALFAIGGAIALYVQRPHVDNSLAALNHCFETNTSNEQPGPDERCLKTTVADLLKSHSTRDLMSYVIASTTPYTVTSYCHEAAHIIGEETYRTSSNVETALSQCSKQCNFGCIHGVIATAVARDLGEEYLSEDMVHADPAEIERIGARYCKNGLCHAVGHILFIGSNDIPKALTACERINAGTTTESCYQGVFMEAAGGAEVFVKKTEPTARDATNYAYPCDTVAATYRHACFQYLTNFQRQLFRQNNVAESEQFDIERRVCQSFPSAKDRSDCFFGIGYIFLRTNQSTDLGENDPRRPSLCETLDGTDEDSCIVGLALKNALADKHVNGIDYCGFRSDAHHVSLCFNALFQVMKNAALTDEAVQARCAASKFPELCSTQFAHYQTVAASLPQYYAEGLLKNH